MTGAGSTGCRHKYLRGICFPTEPIPLTGRWKNSGPKGMNTACTLKADIPGTTEKKRHPLIFFFKFFFFSLFLSAYQPVSQLDANPQQQQHK